LFRLLAQRIHRQSAAGLNRAESATARADVTEDHESRGASREAVVPIRAPSFFADGVKAAGAQHFLQLVIGLDTAAGFTQPLRQTRSRLPLKSFDLNKHIIGSLQMLV